MSKRVGVATGFLAAVGGFLASFDLPSATPPSLALAVIAVVLISIIVREWHNHGDFLTPMGILAIMGILLFALRPLALITNGVTSAGALIDSRFVDATTFESVSAALLLAAAFFASALAGSALVGMRGRARTQEGDSSNQQQTTAIEVKRARKLLQLLSVVCAAAVMTLIVRAGGIAPYLAGLSMRSSFLAGSVFLTLVYVPMLVALLAYLDTRLRHSGAAVDRWSVLGVAVLLVTTLSGGGRAQVVFGCILPLLLFAHARIRPISMKLLTMAGLILVSGSLVLGIVLRDAQFDNGASIAALRTNPIGTLTERLTSGIESRPFDSVVLLHEKSTNSAGAEAQDGATYLASVAFFVPRAAWEDKPFGGGNAWFTANFLPRFYGENRVETSLSAIGEAYANFRTVGVLAAGVLTGVCAELVARMRRNGPTTAPIVIFCALTPVFATFLRGDAFHNLPLALILLCLGYSLSLLIQGRGLSRRSSTDTRVKVRTFG